MATINNEIKTGKETNGEFTVTYQKNGYGAVIPVVDGVQHPELMMGYVSESDCKAGLKLIEKALTATQGDVRAAMMYMYNAARTAANEIKADEAVAVNGAEIIIDYEKRKAYLGTEEVANMDDMMYDLPREAIRTILTERSCNAIEAAEEEYYEEDYEEE